MRGVCGHRYRADMDKVGAVDGCVADADTIFGRELPAIREGRSARPTPTGRGGVVAPVRIVALAAFSLAASATGRGWRMGYRDRPTLSGAAPVTRATG
jgi:hypothetical protein